jgi:hypothetical protein
LRRGSAFWATTTPTQKRLKHRAIFALDDLKHRPREEARSCARIRHQGVCAKNVKRSFQTWCQFLIKIVASRYFPSLGLALLFLLEHMRMRVKDVFACVAAQ